MFFSVSFLFVFGFRRVIWSFDSEEILPLIWMGHFGRTFILMNEENVVFVKTESSCKLVAYFNVLFQILNSTDLRQDPAIAQKTLIKR